MAAGTVISVLSNLPWGQVVDAAPKLAEGAGRLWDAAKHFRKPKPVSVNQSNATQADQLQARLAELDATVQELREQVQATAGVVKELADQNARLVQRMEETGLRLRRIAIGGGLCIVLLFLATLYVWASR